MKSLPILDCRDCGACCMHMGTPPGFAAFFPINGGTIDWMRESEDWDIWHAIRQPIRDELGRYYKAVELGEIEDRTHDIEGRDVPCLWFDEKTRRCKHHEHRPSICREFEVGCQACVEHRIRKGIDRSTLSMLKVIR